jgi:hypothetical protein
VTAPGIGSGVDSFVFGKRTLSLTDLAVVADLPGVTNFIRPDRPAVTGKRGGARTVPNQG